MNAHLTQMTSRPGPGDRGAKAFSLVEILVAVSLLSVIVLGLLMMFNQTQRAFRGSITQTDILESGRIVTDMLAREIEQAAPSMAEPYYVNGNLHEDVNFFAELAPTFQTPFVQDLPGSTIPRTNIVQQFFFMSRQNQDWVGTGYVVIQSAGADVGTLYQYSATKRPPFSDYDLSQVFRANVDLAVKNMLSKLPVTNLNRVADGIIHLRLRLFGANGEPLLPLVGTNLICRLPNGNYDNVGDTYWNLPAGAPPDPDYAGSYFVGDAVPASVELEVGVLEPNILERYKSLDGNGTAQRNYIVNRAGNVHIFRQRIPIRNVETSVYP